MGFTNKLKESIDSLIRAIQRIASGNLSESIPKLGKDELNEIVDGMVAMQNKLGAIVHDIGSVSHSLSLSSREIASSNNHLSERTQDQASCLVETSASLNNLTDTIKVNAESTKTAAALSNNATNLAQKGGDAVNQVILTMDDINQSAQKVYEITSVIDSIAFQTNLLALNASVEAARAGEQGRGFAVVASEVRNLAQRSAEAAKKIKELINDSMIKVASGDTQVKHSYATMKDIVDAIKNVNEIIENISIASAEQSSSIQQINMVISQLEGNTQKNAAQVEEVSASADLLKDHAFKLVEVTRQFTVK
jgi:methyl-accepting chemotaxis protein-2 (aspartate sensor receptor)